MSTGDDADHAATQMGRGDDGRSVQPNASAPDFSIVIYRFQYEAKTPSPSQLSGLRYQPITAKAHCSIKNCRALAFVTSTFLREDYRGNTVATGVFFCRRCQVQCGFTDAKTPINHQLDRCLRPGTTATIGSMMVVGGSPEEASCMLRAGSLRFRRVNPGSNYGQQLRALNAEKPWEGKYEGRGALFTNSSTIRRVSRWWTWPLRG